MKKLKNDGVRVHVDWQASDLLCMLRRGVTELYLKWIDLLG